MIRSILLLGCHLFCVLSFCGCEERKEERKKIKMFRARAMMCFAVLLLLQCCPRGVNGLAFGIIGDWGMGAWATPWQIEIRSDLMLNEVCSDMKCNFTLSVGDNIYVSNVLQGIVDSFEKMFTSPGPFFMSIGNHDNWGPQVDYAKRNKRWKFDNRWYTYVLPIDETGYTVQIFAVDSTDGGLGGGAQFAWLENELKLSTSRWKIIFGHYPTTGSGRHRRVGSVGRIHGLMEQYNAQVYFCGHDHILEVNNVGGRVVALSGAMARGAMMLKGLGGKFRKFSATSPNEYNKYSQDWPIHGFLTAELSPNVLTVQSWLMYGGIQYEFSVTHDWMKQVNSQPESLRNDWPPDEIILKAYKDELTLPKGPGGGVRWVSNDKGEIWIERPDSTSSTTAPTTATAAASTAATSSTPQPVVTQTDAPKTTQEPQQPPRDVPDFVSYAVSTECEACKGNITAGQPFTVIIHGTAVGSSSSQLFLSPSILACQMHDNRPYLAGTTAVQPKSNAVQFTSTAKELTIVYVCFSMNNGNTFRRISRTDDVFGERFFILNPPLQSEILDTPPPLRSVSTSAPPAATSAAPAAAQQQQPQSTSSSGVSSQQWLQLQSPTTETNGHSLSTVLLVGIACLLVGAVGSVLANRLKTGQAVAEHLVAKRGGTAAS